MINSSSAPITLINSGIVKGTEMDVIVDVGEILFIAYDGDFDINVVNNNSLLYNAKGLSGITSTGEATYSKLSIICPTNNAETITFNSTKYFSYAHYSYIGKIPTIVQSGASTASEKMRFCLPLDSKQLLITSSLKNAYQRTYDDCQIIELYKSEEWSSRRLILNTANKKDGIAAVSTQDYFGSTSWQGCSYCLLQFY